MRNLFALPAAITFPFKNRFIFGLFLCLTFAARLHSQPFTLTPDRAFEASFPTKEGYEYQLFSSPDLTNWVPAGNRLIGCGGQEALTFKITNSSTFYRGQEFPPNLNQRFIGLTNVFVGTAWLSSIGDTPDTIMKICGLRIQSRDYTFNDFVIANYSLDFCKQQFSPAQVEVLTNLGITTKPAATTFFFKDVTNSICVTNGASTYCTQDTAYSGITTTGQVMFVGLQGGQLLAVKPTTSGASTEYRYVVTDPEDHEIFSYSPVPASTTFNFGAFQALRTGRYALRFIPLNAASITMTLRFVNTNGRLTRTLVNGATYPSTLRAYPYDYEKFKVALSVGQTLSVSGLEPGTAFTLYNSLGVLQTGITGGTLVFQATVNDTYYLMFYNTDSAAHSVTVAPSVF